MKKIESRESQARLLQGVVIERIEEILTMKGCAVQNSPLDKLPHEPSPWPPGSRVVGFSRDVVSAHSNDGIKIMEERSDAFCDDARDRACPFEESQSNMNLEEVSTDEGGFFVGVNEGDSVHDHSRNKTHVANEKAT